LCRGRRGQRAGICDPAETRRTGAMAKGRTPTPDEFRKQAARATAAGRVNDEIREGLAEARRRDEEDRKKAKKGNKS
jgi:hypothetical protein